MNVTKRNEELLREASAFGDEEAVQSLIESGADINAQHSLNGWYVKYYYFLNGLICVKIFKCGWGVKSYQKFEIKLHSFCPNITS